MIKLINKEQIEIKVLQQAVQKLREALSLPKTEINRDATIQRFEFSFELAWKLMQKQAESETLESYGPKNSIRQVAKIGLINNPEVWFKFLNARNLTTHTYNEEIADKVYQDAQKFLPEVEKFIEKIINLE